MKKWLETHWKACTLVLLGFLILSVWFCWFNGREMARLAKETDKAVVSLEENIKSQDKLSSEYMPRPRRRWQNKMRKSGKTLKILTTMLLLLSLLLCLTNIAESATEPRQEIEYITCGWTAPANGYYMSELAGRDILEGWLSDRTAKDTYKSTLDELYGEWQAFKGDMTAQIAVVKNSLTAEREANKAAQRKARAPGFGVFGGVGYTTSGGVRGVVGVGLVWKVF